MRYDEAYKPKPQSMQMELPGLGSKGEADVAEARQWIADNPGPWGYIVDNAHRLSRKGYVSANYLVNMVRNELHVKVKNGYAPIFARIMEADHPHLKDAFNKHRSQSDGFAS